LLGAFSPSTEAGLIVGKARAEPMIPLCFKKRRLESWFAFMCRSIA
jgi:hypothetical protein